MSGNFPWILIFIFIFSPWLLAGLVYTGSGDLAQVTALYIDYLTNNPDLIADIKINL